MTHINQRRDTAANWTSANPVLALGEVGIERDTKKTKQGDGSTAWNALAYATVPPLSPAFTGSPTAPTAAPGNNSTLIATTAFVAAGLALKANLASPTFTGTPSAPTAAKGTSTTQLATTAFVTDEFIFQDMITLGAQDLNTMRTSGFFYVTTPTNPPGSQPNGYLMVSGDGSFFGCQIFISKDGTLSWFRASDGVSAWSAWRILGNASQTTATASLDYNSIPAQTATATSYQTLTITLTGAVVNDTVIAGAPTTLPAGLSWSCWVSAADTISIRVYNNTNAAVDPPSATWRVRIVK